MRRFPESTARLFDPAQYTPADGFGGSLLVLASPGSFCCDLACSLSCVPCITSSCWELWCLWSWEGAAGWLSDSARGGSVSTFEFVLFVTLGVGGYWWCSRCKGVLGRDLSRGSRSEQRSKGLAFTPRHSGKRPTDPCKHQSCCSTGSLAGAEVTCMVAHDGSQLEPRVR